MTSLNTLMMSFNTLITSSNTLMTSPNTLMTSSNIFTAHIHHALEQYEDGVTIQNIIIATSFQAFYTTIFGIFSSYIFLRTGHLISSFISHAFCNIMGFPDFETAFNHKYRFFVAIFYIFGLLLFIFNLYSLTNPTIFNNVLYT